MFALVPALGSLHALACVALSPDAPLLLTTGLGDANQLVVADQLLYARVGEAWVAVDGEGRVTRDAAPPVAPAATTPVDPCPGNAGTPLAAATDHLGRRFVACTADATGNARGGDFVFRVDGPTPALVSSGAGRVRAMAFGPGGLLSPENLYLLQSGGTIAYLRPP